MAKTEQFAVGIEAEGARIDRFLASLYTGEAQGNVLSRASLQRLIEDGQVTVDGKIVKKSHVLHADDLVSVTIPDVTAAIVLPEDLPLDILYEDEDLLVVNKPKDMVVHPSAGHTSGTLVNAVLFHCKDSLSGVGGVQRPGIVHRIDKDTTGSLIVCKNDFAHASIAAQLKEHTCERIYEGIVVGDIEESSGIIEGYIGRDPLNRLRMKQFKDPGQGKYAKTHYEVKEHFKGYAYVWFRLTTGRTHQIRVHLASIGHPLLGDPLYGNGKSPYKTVGQCLHARHIAFDHPRTYQRIEIDAPTPDYLETILHSLRTAHQK